MTDAFDAVVPDGAERRGMFGYPCAFWSGNMFIGLHRENFGVRLAEKDRTRAGREWDAGPLEPWPGRVMREPAG